MHGGEAVHVGDEDGHQDRRGRPTQASWPGVARPECAWKPTGRRRRKGTSRADHRRRVLLGPAGDRLADLLAVEDDPLTDLAAPENVRTVITRGTHHQPGQKTPG